MTARTGARWAGYVAFAIAFAVACGFLANWQFARSAEREAQLALVEANYDAPARPLGDLIPAGAAFDPADQWHPVEMTGQYLADEQLLVRNRPHGGTSAFEVLVPFLTSDGRVLIIDRGWVPPGADQPDPDVVPAPPTGDVTVIARLKPSEPLPRAGRSVSEGKLPTIHVPLIAELIDAEGTAVADAYGLMVSEDPAAATTPNPLASPSDDPGPHLSYAIQWILFAIMGFVFIWYMIRTERRHRREDAADDDDHRVSGPREKRRDRDMADEDALLDAAPSR